MNILLAQPLPCIPAVTGAAHFNRRLLQALAERNHACRFLGLAAIAERPEALHRLLVTLTAKGITSHASSNSDVYYCDGIEIHVVPDARRLWAQLREQIRQFNPTCVLIAEDRTFLGVATALEEAGSRRVAYLAFSPASLPFGPECFLPDPAKTSILSRVARIFVQSEYMREYVRRWSGLEAHVMSIPVYGSGPFPHFGRPSDGFVTLVNPSHLKGISIFQELASVFRGVEFAAVPTWATTSADRQALERLPNVRLLPPAVDIDDIFAKTRVLLVPSLWGEAYGLIVPEAMLRGIPVLASNVGGLPEAKLGVDYLLPVHRIERYHTRLDDRALPIPVVPRQDTTPWIEALARLLSDPTHYGQLSALSRAAALDYVSNLSIDACERDLEGMASAVPDKVWRPNSLTMPTHSDSLESLNAASRLSSERLELLAALLSDPQNSRDSGAS